MLPEQRSCRPAIAAQLLVHSYKSFYTPSLSTLHVFIAATIMFPNPASFVGDIKTIVVLVVFGALSVIYLAFFREEQLISGFPAIGVEKNGLFRMQKARSHWIVNGCQILEQGAKQACSSQPSGRGQVSDIHSSPVCFRW